MSTDAPRVYVAQMQPGEWREWPAAVSNGTWTRESVSTSDWNNIDDIVSAQHFQFTSITKIYRNDDDIRVEMHLQAQSDGYCGSYLTGHFSIVPIPFTTMQDDEVVNAVMALRALVALRDDNIVLECYEPDMFRALARVAMETLIGERVDADAVDARAAVAMCANAIARGAPALARAEIERCADALALTAAQRARMLGA